MSASQEITVPVVHPTDAATGVLPVDGRRPITVIGTDAIRTGFDAHCLRQAINSAQAPGVTAVVLNPDAHAGYGAPVGSVLVSQTHIYPGLVGVDIKCSMSLLQLDLPADADLLAHDVLSNCRQYPVDKAPDAYKDFNEVLTSVELAGLATPVAKLQATFEIKDGGQADD